jgi:hypothetical protein
MPVAELLIAGAVAAIAPHLRSAGEALVEGAGRIAGEQIGALIALIRRRFAKGDKGDAELDALAEAPGDAARQEAVAARLRAVIEEDPEFAAAFERLARPVVSGDTEMRVDVREGGQVGKVVQARDVGGDINL